DLERMAARLRHRAPDGWRVWCDGAVGLAEAAPPAGTGAPAEARGDAGGVPAIAAEARLGNRDELLAALGPPGAAHPAIAAAALILAAYERWGEGCPAHLLGDFAFALWDGKRQALFCARDHFGVKQLYYHCTERAFAFATELGALLALPWVPRRLNEARVADY